MEEIKAAAARASRDLPEKLILEILALVSTDAAALFRCASTCKRWRALIAAPPFLRRCWPEYPPSALAGFFTRQPHGRLDNDDSTTPYPLFFVPTPGGRSVLGARRRLLASFIPGAPLDGAVELAARDGLVLVRLDRGYWLGSVHLAVCDILAGACHVLPPIHCEVASVDSAIFTGADCRRSSKAQTAFFKVAIIVSSSYVAADKECSLYAFSSDEAAWSAPRKCLDELRHGGGGNQFFLAKDAVVCRGVAHWLVSCFEEDPAKYYTLEVSAETNRASLTEISFPSVNADEPFAPTDFGAKLVLGAYADGALSLLCLYHELPDTNGIRRLETWTRGGNIDDHSGGGWFRRRAVEVKPPARARGRHGCVHVWSVEKGGKLVVVHDDFHDRFECVYSVDVETGSVEEQPFWNGLGTFAVPMEIDFPALFATRLR